MTTSRRLSWIVVGVTSMGLVACGGDEGSGDERNGGGMGGAPAAGGAGGVTGSCSAGGKAGSGGAALTTGSGGAGMAGTAPTPADGSSADRSDGSDADAGACGNLGGQCIPGTSCPGLAPSFGASCGPNMICCAPSSDASDPVVDVLGPKVSCTLSGGTCQSTGSIAFTAPFRTPTAAIPTGGCAATYDPRARRGGRPRRPRPPR
jgi:hypothetical protein